MENEGSSISSPDIPLPRLSYPRRQRAGTPVLQVEALSVSSSTCVSPSALSPLEPERELSHVSSKKPDLLYTTIPDLADDWSEKDAPNNPPNKTTNAPIKTNKTNNGFNDDDDPITTVSHMLTRLQRRIYGDRPGEELKKCTPKTVLVIIALTVAVVALCTVAFLNPPVTDAASCRMSFMTPSYVKMDSFDLNHTRFASKYALHLYREQKLDAESAPNGIPVVFIPGNAGSFRQVRAIAAECAFQYVASRGANQSTPLTADFARGFDFYTADFSEDLTAFHGRTLLDQAEYLNDAIRYILARYKKKIPSHGNSLTAPAVPLPPPQSVILIGHSMGGVVARTMVTLPNYVPHSVNTIVTLAAPHSLPPVTMDSEVVAIYDRTNRYWEQSFSQEQIGQNPLAEVSLVSIAGGSLDHMIPSDHANIESLVPPSNGFTVYTSSIPYLWSGVDHQAMVWCDQFRKVLARTLFEIADVRSPAKTKPLSSRMAVFRKRLLAGFERVNPRTSASSMGGGASMKGPIASADVPALVGPPDTLLIGDDIGRNVVPYGRRLRLTNLGEEYSNASAMTYLIPLPGYSDKFNDTAVTLMSDQPLLAPSKYSTVDLSQPHEHYDSDTSDGLYLLACKHLYPSTRFRESLLSVVDLARPDYRETRSAALMKSLRGRSTKSHRQVYQARRRNEIRPFKKSEMGLMCRNLADQAIALPRPSSKEPLAPPSEADPLYYVNLNVSQLSDYDFLAVVDAHTRPTPGFVLTDVEHYDKSHITVPDSLLSLVFGKRIRLPTFAPAMVDISFPAVWSSLIAYKVSVAKSVDGDDGHDALFMPFMRQYTTEPYESKYALNLYTGVDITLNMHSVAPFTPFSTVDTQSNSYSYHNLHLQLWKDNESFGEEALEFYFKVDIMGTLARLALHYRAALALVPIAVTAVVLLIQYDVYNRGGAFISFGEALRVFSNSYLVYLVAFCACLPLITSFQIFQQLLYLVEPAMDPSTGEGPSTIFTATRQNRFFLGLEGAHLWFLGPVLVVISTGLCFIVYYTLLALVTAASGIITMSESVFGYSPIHELMQSPSASSFPDRGSRTLLCGFPRTAASIIAIVTVAVFVPYQFGVVVATLVELVTTVRAFCALSRARSSRGYEDDSQMEEYERCKSFASFNMTVLVVLMWLLPINVLVLVVWLRNLVDKWFWTISLGWTQHNFVSVAPIIVLVQKLASGEMMPRMALSSAVAFTRLMLGYIAFYTLIFGIQRAYWLHHLFNFFFAWILVAAVVVKHPPPTNITK
ncbi:GPI inositol-deacylase [Trichomonascus vanleenenianus]|uniref:GPI inositol-deacylase n=1 Tax=Trichomonascus vanleenenianus TaxID=2268995 RepID=UPI003ECAF10D